MDILVVGNGGREHVLCWKLAQSRNAGKIYCAPGNAGIAASGAAATVDIKAADFERLADFAASHGIGLTVVGPEAPLCGGIVDVFRKRGLKIFGPDKFAARLEGSKDFAKRFMVKYNIPCAKSATFTAAAAAVEYVEKEFASGAPGIVVKADGLAAGKGVLVAENCADACEFVRGCFDGAFGESGHQVLIEEKLVGEEASIFALVDTKSIRALASSQDHKRVGDGDRGPNTGGMGAYSPAPVVTDKVMAQIQTEILDNFLRGVKAEKLDFHGVIFVGVMIDNGRAKVLEFNVRFGDPEVQPVLMRLKSDLLDAMLATVEENLADCVPEWSDDPAVSVIVASGGYPGKCDTGHEITGLDAAAAAGVQVFHAGTSLDAKGRIVNSGGRVLGVAARGKTVREAVEKAYRGVDAVHFENCFSRRDIAYRALQREKA
ncbi:MAG: phosphoribosylamine--glycine ligase [Victivallaceae bacterium]|nr:phosphoribosylamine--glycine ligase [Victivallaceae bacterium]